MVIPPVHGQALYEAATTPAKRLLLLQGRGHNDIDIGEREVLAAIVATVAGPAR